jgi:hypothetical protein
MENFPYCQGKTLHTERLFNVLFLGIESTEGTRMPVGFLELSRVLM